MNKLLNLTMKRFLLYAALVLVCSVPVYYLALNRLWQYEMTEHNIVLDDAEGREDSYLIILAVTSVTLVFFVLLMFGFILLNRRISGKLWQPFYKSMDQIKHFDLSSQQSVQFEQTNITEFSEMNQHLRKLIAGNVAAYSQQKEFADNASHELQTPLAIIQFKLDLLMQTSNLSNEQYQLIEDASKALSRVTRINKNLLLLTKIENSQYMEEDNIDLSALLHHTIQTFTVFADDKQLVFEEDIHPGISIRANKILLEILLNNLINNAIRYSSNGAVIRIRLAENTLTVSNAGNTPLIREHLFRRFSATSADSPGTGLGLALIKQISTRYGWAIDYSFDNHQHHFTLKY
ncbi:HAMP domain-containing histidine kinase [Pseudoflavitalea sp. G-6-1-2]|uniref:sensor histidine kinase n=1 Tax=Pseudoflavitalea sp. G-6-1-2 TaxID=2728841 RepID=UPI001469D8B7|nr:HAMP domain-containing sensor histidine kinase [Pseudoflavitalea sp. G-6-1-2]NML21437.1 HAMP domain-containing histidine kinase [Pseudoflavitalea sp. G-6-1-2]